MNEEINADVSIRVSTEEDLRSILNLNIDEYWERNVDWQNSSQFKRIEKGSWWCDLATLKWHYDIIKNCNGNIILLFVKDKLVGELDYVHSPDIIIGNLLHRIHIIWVLVDKSHRRKNYARKMIEYLKSLTSLPIWVESEDNRSQALYTSLGVEKLNICNWQININDTSNLINKTKIQSFKSYSITNLQNLDLNYWQVLVGRYYAPCFDLYQLSHSGVASRYIWGELERYEIINYKTNTHEVIAVITQYPRVYVKNGKINSTELLSIILDLIIRCFYLGYEEIYFQIYKNKLLSDIFEEIGMKMISNNDPVFEI